jgi:hypothetical protein
LDVFFDSLRHADYTKRRSVNATNAGSSTRAIVIMKAIVQRRRRERGHMFVNLANIHTCAA